MNEYKLKTKRQETARKPEGCTSVYLLCANSFEEAIALHERVTQNSTTVTFLGLKVELIGIELIKTNFYPENRTVATTSDGYDFHINEEKIWVCGGDMEHSVCPTSVYFEGPAECVLLHSADEPTSDSLYVWGDRVYHIEDLNDFGYHELML